MHPTEYDIWLQQFDSECSGISSIASQEYASNEDKFTNFNIVAHILRLNPRLKDILPEDVAWVYRLKHIISRVKDVSIREDMRGRAIDDANYGKLIEAMREQRVLGGREDEDDVGRGRGSSKFH